MTVTHLELTSTSEADTDSIGAALAKTLHVGDVVALRGPLGAGKTRLVRAVVVALDGVDAPVNSPTFVIVQRYDVAMPVYHIDAYRLADVDEFWDLGSGEILDGNGVCFIEWADRVAEVLPDDRLTIDIHPISPTSRRLTLQASGVESERKLDILRSIRL